MGRYIVDADDDSESEDEGFGNGIISAEDTSTGAGTWSRTSTTTGTNNSTNRDSAIVRRSGQVPQSQSQDYSQQYQQQQQQQQHYPQAHYGYTNPQHQSSYNDQHQQRFDDSSTGIYENHHYNQNHYNHQMSAYHEEELYRGESPSSQSSPSLRKRKRGFLRHIIIIIILVMSQHYAPPPPPPNHSWNEYLSHSSKGFIATLSHVTKLASYIISGTFENAYGDGIYYLREYVYVYFKSGGVGVGHADMSKEEDEFNAGRSSCNIMIPGGSGNHTTFDIDTDIGTKSRKERIDPISIMKGFMGDRIAGQEIPLHQIANAISAWDPYVDADEDSDPSTSATSAAPAFKLQMKTQRPLSLLFTGSDGVGKQELAMQVAKMLLNHGCSHVSQLRESSMDSSDMNMHMHMASSSSSSCADCNNAILELRGIDYALDPDKGEGDEESAEDEDSQSKGMIHQILNHIHARDRAGAVIIISHGENLSKSATSDLVRLLGKSTVSFKKKTLARREYGFGSFFRLSTDTDTDTDSAIAANEHDEVVVNVHLDLGNCVFIVTSDLGADKIFGGIRAKMSSSSWSGVRLGNNKELYDKIQSDLMEDAKNHFGPHTFTKVIPFLPLQYSSMEEVLKRIAMDVGSSKYASRRDEKHNIKIQIHETLMKHLVSPAIVEYIEMKSAPLPSNVNTNININTNKVHSFIFSKYGAHDLKSHTSTLFRKIDDILGENAFYSVDEVAILEYIGSGKVQLKLCNGDGKHHCVDHSTVDINEILNL